MVFVPRMAGIELRNRAAKKKAEQNQASRNIQQEREDKNA
jgi:hypothetical protein